MNKKTAKKNTNRTSFDQIFPASYDCRGLVNKVKTAFGRRIIEARVELTEERIREIIQEELQEFRANITMDQIRKDPLFERILVEISQKVYLKKKPKKQKPMIFKPVMMTKADMDFLKFKKLCQEEITKHFNAMPKADMDFIKFKKSKLKNFNIRRKYGE